MKKITKFIIAFAVVGILFSGCEQVLDTITNTPSFYIPDKLYDGQEYRLTRLSTCKYEWSVDSPCIEIKKTDGEVAIAYTDLAIVGNKATVVKITAKNPDKADEPPVEEEVRVMPWSLVVCDMSGNSISNPNTLQAGTKYQIRAEGSPEYLRGGLLKDKMEYHELEWTATMGTLSAPKLKDGETDHTMAKTFECTHSGQVTITARLCKKTVSRTLNVVDAAAI